MFSLLSGNYNHLKVLENLINLELEMWNFIETVRKLINNSISYNTWFQKTNYLF